MELVISTIAGIENALIFYGFYMYVLALAVIIVFQLKFLNSAMRCGDALFVVPVYQVAYIILTILGGGVFYEEFNCFGIGKLHFILIFSLNVLSVFLSSPLPIPFTLRSLSTTQFISSF